MGVIDMCEEADTRRAGKFRKMEGPVFRGAGKFLRGWDGGGCFWNG